MLNKLTVVLSSRITIRIESLPHTSLCPIYAIIAVKLIISSKCAQRLALSSSPQVWGEIHNWIY